MTASKVSDLKDESSIKDRLTFRSNNYIQIPKIRLYISQSFFWSTSAPWSRPRPGQVQTGLDWPGCGLDVTWTWPGLVWTRSGPGLDWSGLVLVWTGLVQVWTPAVCGGRTAAGGHAVAAVLQVSELTPQQQTLRRHTHLLIQLKAERNPVRQSALSVSVKEFHNCELRSEKVYLPQSVPENKVDIFSPPEVYCLFLLESLIQTNTLKLQCTRLPARLHFPSSFRACYWIMQPVSNSAAL